MVDHNATLGPPPPLLGSLGVTSLAAAAAAAVGAAAVAGDVPRESLRCALGIPSWIREDCSTFLEEAPLCHSAQVHYIESARVEIAGSQDHHMILQVKEPTYPLSYFPSTQNPEVSQAA